MIVTQTAISNMDKWTGSKYPSLGFFWNIDETGAHDMVFVSPADQTDNRLVWGLGGGEPFCKFMIDHLNATYSFTKDIPILPELEPLEPLEPIQIEPWVSESTLLKAIAIAQTPSIAVKLLGDE